MSSDGNIPNGEMPSSVPTTLLIGNPTILIVDDEELLRDVTSIMIEENGGTVLTAVDGMDGVNVFKQNREKIDVVFMDFSMPRMNGYEAYLELKKIEPEIAVIMVSGLTVTPEVDELRKKREVEFLSKPFHEAELMKLINQLIAKPK